MTDPEPIADPVGADNTSTPTEPELRRWILTRLSERTSVDAVDIDPSVTFASLGVDSVAAVELIADLETHLGRELDPTLVFSAESPAQLASVLASGASGMRRRHRVPKPTTTELPTVDGGPIAVVGIGCRLPGAPDAASYWKMLLDGRDAVSKVPDGRWDPDPSLPPSVNVGGFVDDLDQFDPGFFRITQLEADRMDPQQRMLLEVAWEALEDGAVRPSDVRGTDVGVFVGISANEYSRRQSSSPELIDVYFGTGNALSIAANRISYTLDLQGPSIAVDTACSSSLVAVHLACQSLSRGECTSALAGGANAILTPLLTLNFTGAGVIAPDGRCKTFDASADGIVRGEGAGMVLLKRLADAITDGDRVYCVIEGSATNQDGRSNGLTAPNPDAQIDVFTAACASARVQPSDIDYVEAHGTGTVLGDAMELRSLDAVYGVGRPDGSELLVGSVKTNIGHLESAAGVAGLIKTALSLHHGTIPPTLHYREPNPYLSQTSHIRVADEVIPWRSNGVRRAGVSGFGFGGTNAHLVLASSPDEPHEVMPIGHQDPASTGAGRLPIILPLSAHSRASLEASVRAHSELLADDPDRARALATAQALTRDEHPRRLAFVASDESTLAAALGDVAAGRRSAAAIDGERRSGDRARVAFLFSGQGRAWWPFDEQLIDDPVIGSVLRTCDSEMREIADYSMLEIIRSGEAVMDHERAQPLLFALQVAIASRWRAFGVEPDLIVGQSIGEIAAAHIAGALPLADALEIVAHRGRLMQESNGTGYTAFVELPVAETEAMITDLGLDVAIAAVTAPDNCVVSGPKDDTSTIVEAATGRGVMAQIFDVGDIPGHGPLMSPYADKLADAVDFLDPRAVSVPMISSVTASLVQGEDLGADYWARNLRQQVRLLEAIEVAIEQGTELFIEIAPHPVVSFSTRRTLESIGSDALVQHSFKQGEPGIMAFMRSLAAAWAGGARVDWRAVTGQARPTARALPYPWDHRRCWFDIVPSRRQQPASPRSSGWHPLLDDAELLGDGAIRWQATPTTAVGLDSDTTVAGTVLELALAAVGSATGSTAFELSDVRLASGPRRLLGDVSDVRLAVHVETRSDGLRWRVIADDEGSDGDRVRVIARGAARALDDLPHALLVPDRFAIDAPSLEISGLPAQVTAAKADESTAVLTVTTPRTIRDEPGWTVGPPALEAAVAAAVGLSTPGRSAMKEAELREIGTIRRIAPLGESTRVILDRLTGDITLVDEWAAPVVEMRAPVIRPAPPVAPIGGLLVPEWTRSSDTDGAADAVGDSKEWIVLGPPDGLPAAVRLADRLGTTVVNHTTAVERIRADKAALVVLGADNTWLSDLLETGVLGDRPVYLVTYDSAGSESAPYLIRQHPEVVLRSVDTDGSRESEEALVQFLQSRSSAQVSRIRHGLAYAGQLTEVPVPEVVTTLAPADGREHAAVLGHDGRIHVRTVDPDLECSEETDRVLVRPTKVIVGGAGTETPLPGDVVAVAAVGKVIEGPEALHGTTVAVVTEGAARTLISVPDSNTWPVPDPDIGIAALAALLELHPDPLTAVRRCPEAIGAAFDVLVRDSHNSIRADTDLARITGAMPMELSVISFGDPTTLVEEVRHRFDATGRWAVLATHDDPLADSVLAWLRDRGATVGAFDDEAPDASPAVRVVAIGAAPTTALPDLDAHLIWIAPSSLLLGTSTPTPEELETAAAVSSRRDRHLPTTTFLVGPDVDDTTALDVLDRVMLQGVEVAVYDPGGQAGLAGTKAVKGGWFEQLVTPRSTTSSEVSDDSFVAQLMAVHADAHQRVVSDHVSAEIAAIIGIEVTDIDQDEPLDTYGVDSLVGMEMRSRIQASFAYEVPLSELSRTMTVRQLTDHLVEHAVPSLVTLDTAVRFTDAKPADGNRSTAVAVRNGDGPTTWWVPGIFGSAEVFTPLGTALDGHKMWALEPDGAPAGSVTDAATAHLRTVRSRQPTGPYRIGGYSYGALVALELALALEESGEVVEHLWLLDPPPPFTPDDDSTRVSRATQVGELLAAQLRGLFGVADLAALDLPPLTMGADLGPLTGRLLTGTSTWNAERISGYLERVWAMASASLQAMAIYHPSGVVAAPTDLVTATRSGLTGLLPGAHWEDFVAGPLNRTDLDTDHPGLMEAAEVVAVAEVIRRSLRAPSTPRMEDQMPTAPAADTVLRRTRNAIVNGVTHSQRSRSAVGAVGSAYRQADYFLRALGAERRFRRVCVPGDDFIVGEHAQISNLTGDPERIRFGNNCLVDGFINVQEYGYFTMGSYSGIGEKVRIDCAGYVEIGNGCTMAEGVYIIDGLHHPILADERIKHGIDLFRGDHVMDAYGTGTETSFVRIEDLVWIGLRAIVLSGVTIGRGSVVAAGAVVSQDVPPFSVVAGNPARVVGRIPDDDFDIETHPTYLAVHGDERLPDNRRPVREVLEEIAARVANRST